MKIIVPLGRGCLKWNQPRKAVQKLGNHRSPRSRHHHLTSVLQESPTSCLLLFLALVFLCKCLSLICWSSAGYLDLPSVLRCYFHARAQCSLDLVRARIFRVFPLQGLTPHHVNTDRIRGGLLFWQEMLTAFDMFVDCFCHVTFCFAFCSKCSHKRNCVKCLHHV